jgi:hypothetical protein
MSNVNGDNASDPRRGRDLFNSAGQIGGRHQSASSRPAFLSCVII